MTPEEREKWLSMARAEVPDMIGSGRAMRELLLSELDRVTAELKRWRNWLGDAADAMMAHDDAGADRDCGQSFQRLLKRFDILTATESGP